MIFTKQMLNSLDQGQVHLFKRILGVPQSTANELVFLLLDLKPLSLQLQLDTLLMLGQLVCLPPERLERRILLICLVQNSPLISYWNTILERFLLPELSSLVLEPPRYQAWKKLVKSRITQHLYDKLASGIIEKSSLSLWKDQEIFSGHTLFPRYISSPHLRQAIRIRNQLVSQTYLTQARLQKINRATSDVCPLCGNDIETTIHFVATCHVLANERTFLYERIANGCLREYSAAFDSCNPDIFCPAVLFLPDDTLPEDREQLLIITLNFVYKIHYVRSKLCQDAE